MIKTVSVFRADNADKPGVERVRTAIHEAGHAIVAERLGMDWSCVMIHPSDEETSVRDLAGSTWTRLQQHFDSPNDFSIETWEHFAVLICAGISAERVATDADGPAGALLLEKTLSGARSDLEQLAQVADRIRKFRPTASDIDVYTQARKTADDLIDQNYELMLELATLLTKASIVWRCDLIAARFFERRLAATSRQ